MTLKNVALTSLVAGVLACGDANTGDDRGYTKAPLENPGVLIEAEGSSAMDSLGTPVVPRDTLIEAEAAPAPATRN